MMYTHATTSLPLHSTWSSRRGQIKVAIEYLTSPELADKPVQIIVETQLLLTPYLEGREKMHLLSVTSLPSNTPSSTVQLVKSLAVLVISLAVLKSIIFSHPPSPLPLLPDLLGSLSVLMI
jgi:hypothetical protein